MALAGWLTVAQIGGTMLSEAKLTLDPMLRLRADVVSTFGEMQQRLTAEPCSPAYHEQLRAIAFLPDAEIARLNLEYLGHEGPTDVISFQLPDPGDRIVGDIYIGAEQAERQAAELGAGHGEELLRLAIHGTLHILGYEHPEDDGREESVMYHRQEELLAALLRDPDLTR